MASQTSVSFTNLIKAATITVSSEASGYPRANLQEPEIHGLPFRTTAITDSWIVIDLGSAIPFDRISVIGTNFTSMKIQQHTSDSWGAPAYDSGTLTIGRDPDQRLYRRWFASSANFTRRYTRIFIPAQTPVDGASYFEVYCGLHLGTFTTVPHGIPVFPAMSHARATPRVLHTAALGGWKVAYESGETFSEPRYSRFAELSRTTPGIGDNYATWLGIDRQIDAARIFCLAIDWRGPGAVGMFRQMNDHGWTDEGATVMRDSWELCEAIAG